MEMDRSIIKHGLSRRFSIALTGVVSLVILVFSIIAVVHNNTKIETRLGQKLLRTSKLAETSLPSAVWQVDYESMADLLDAIFTDETIVHASITFEEETLAKKGRPPFDQSPFSFFKASSQFMVNTVEIHKAGKKIGNFHIAISREKTNKEFLLNLLGIAVFTLIVIAAISITCIVLTRRYIFDPLLKLEKSTGMIANGDLEASIVVAHDDEVGWLARSIVNMRDAIKEKIKQLEQAEKKYRNIFDNALEGIFQAFPDGRLMNVNHSAASILGYDSPADM
ncbi:MAG: HAMP domain-containing protein, partial [Proteobacteria bacterium]|nr:HAMP domain-containing protein [Desulfobacula sp.]MBU4131240.1 HAMP domain-containing protein [Pseudomonadota bacterium]